MAPTEEDNHPAALVARFLATNGYDKTLSAFLQEANLPRTAATTTAATLTLESLLDAQRRFDTTQSFTKGDDSPDSAPPKWTTPSPSHATLLPLPTGARHNILHVSAAPLRLGVGESDAPVRLVVTTAMKAVCVFDILPRASDLAADVVLAAHWTPMDAPVLSWRVLTPEWSVGCAMSGQVVLFSTCTARVVAQRRDHRKYVVRVSVLEIPGGEQGGDQHHAVQSSRSRRWYLATAGWDGRVYLYRLEIDSQDDGVAPALDAPIASLQLPTNPEDVLLHWPASVSGPAAEPILIITRRESASLHYYAVPDLQLLGTQTLAPHSGPWTPFSLTHLALSPTEPEIVAVATSSTPSTKLMIVRMLIPPGPTAVRREGSDGTSADAAAAARRAIAAEDAAAAAIRVAAATHSPSSAYSSPSVVWRPDGSGVWVNSDDGAVRGLEARSGHVVVTLGPEMAVRQDHGHPASGQALAHDVDCKIRDLWAGLVPGGFGGGAGGQEWLLTGGFDRKALLWRLG